MTLRRRLRRRRARWRRPDITNIINMNSCIISSIIMISIMFVIIIIISSSSSSSGIMYLVHRLM